MTEEEKVEAEVKAFESQLQLGPQRFLAYVLMNSLECGRRTAEDFIRHFPPADIMSGLRDRAFLRSKILVAATGVKRKIALKKSPESSGEDLQIALDEGEVDAGTVVALIDPDDRVRYLDNRALWSFITEGEFWKASSDKEANDRAKLHIAFMLDRALSDQLLTHQDIVEGISVAKLVDLLPRADLGEIIAGALANSRTKKPFTDQDLLRQAPSEVLVKHIPLEHIWESVIAPKVAIAHGYAEAPPELPTDESEGTTEPDELAVSPEVPGSAAQDAPPAESERKRKPAVKGAVLGKVFAKSNLQAKATAANSDGKKSMRDGPALRKVVSNEEPTGDEDIEAALANIRESTGSDGS